MLTDEELAALCADLESDRVERKESLASSVKDRVGQAICAFANDLPGHRQPGYVLIGVTDAGAPSGVAITDELLRDLGAYHDHGRILPLPRIVVEKRSIGGHDIAVVEVHPSSDTPVYYEGRVWVRVGSRRALASREEIGVLTERRQAADLRFDQRRASSATLADLDLEFFRSVYLPGAVSAEMLAENRRSVEEQLAALHLLTKDEAPNNAAVLLFGKDPRQQLPGAYVQFARFEGREITAPVLDQKEIDGPATEVLRELDELTRINIRIATAIEGHVTERRQPDYPASALQQLLRNAVLHRTYEVNTPISWYWFDDRVEIHSPGGLYGRVDASNFGQPYATDYRNPTVAEGLKILGFVQRFGLGIALARQACTTNGNPAPEFAFGPQAVLALIRRTA